MGVKVAIIGATGYSGLELIGLLSRHREAKIVYLGTRSSERPKISTVHPCLLGVCDLVAEPIDLDVAAGADIVFLCVPHTASMELAPGLLQRGARVVDFSADYRLKDPDLYARWYDHEHSDPGNLKTAVYGLPELFAERIRSASLVAVPGCYPTAVILAAFAPLAEGLVEPVFVADAKSGLSGAGRKLTLATHFVEANESVWPYSVGAHRHTPEMNQVLSQAAGGRVQVEFVPHLVPMDRGIEATLYFRPKGKVDDAAVAAAFHKHYDKAPFVRLRGDAFARTRDVTHTNFCDIAWKVTANHVVVSSVVDNLIKGAAGAAVECMNVMFDMKRTEGLL